MPASSPVESYGKLAPLERHLAQLCAISGESLKPNDLAALSKQCGWTKRDGKKVTQADARTVVKKLLRTKVLQNTSYSGARINPDVQDLIVQDSIREDWFDTLGGLLQKKYPRSSYNYYQTGRISRDLRIAFYQSDVDTFKSLMPEAREAMRPANMLDPFNQELYSRLDPLLQEMYLVDVLPKMIVSGDGDRDAVKAFEQLVESQTDLSNDLVACAIDVYVAGGRLDSLADLDRRTNNKWGEIAGCQALLSGDWERAESAFAIAMPIGKRGSKKSKTATKHLPALLYLLLLLKNNSAEARGQAFSLVSTVAKARGGRYTGALDVFKAAISFQQSPSSPAEFATTLCESCRSPLASILAGYVWNWSLTADDAKFNISGLVQASAAYQRMDLPWLAAEAAGLAGKSSLKTAAKSTKKAKALHGQLGTKSPIDVVSPAPIWERALQAIGQLANDGAAAIAPPVQSEQRMIWEITYSTKYNNLDLRPILQKRNANGWTKGRRVALERLYQQHNDAEFAFLSEQDVALCRALQMDTDRNHYGYTETTYYFDEERAARAIVGHPCIFLEGDRENPVEIVEKEPHLVVTKSKDKRIALSLNPEPTNKMYGDEDDFAIIEEGPRRLAIVLFNEKHHMLHEILGGTLTVPASAADRVMESIQPVASLVSVHSEIGGGESAGKTVAAQPRPHLHLLPFHAGLQLKFYVRPFGEEGPFFIPGEGAETVVAKIGEQTQTARRDLDEERRQQSAVIADCPAVAMQADGDTICFPSAAEALETLLQLEELVAEEKIVLHWPQGRSLQLAGQASGSQFRVNVRKDRDWFAASGKLKVDPSLSLDLMRLIELVEASPSRFVKLDDGRFLALTEQLRQRIEDLSAYSERAKGKLRFPPIRSAALEDLEDAVSLKADNHWQQCVQRMREAGEINAEVPSTLSAELRDYQLEGFQWLARLAHWGAGACLADDMGLGKTIQALALLLHRSADGPALVVAPTSVAFNWQNEIHRFAPTLNVRLFGTGDRQAALQDLGPRDVMICSYGLLHSEAKRLQTPAWHTVILDEAQAIKNVATKRSQAAMKLEADFRLIMTGTPLENHLGELWNLFQFINPGLLGSLESFQDRFATPIERDGCRETRRRLKRLIQPFILRRTKSQVLDELPSRTEITLKVELSDEEAAFYEALRQRAIEKLDEAGGDGPQHLRILAELMRLRRACCHPRLVMEDSGISSSKLELFSDTLDEVLDNRHKVLVFSQFVDHLTVIREELDCKGVSYQYLDGSTPARQRKQRVEAFQAGEGDVFLISLKAGGLGLNLTAADYVIHMDPWWNPAVEDQASDRAHRLGQQRPVTIYRLIAQGTIEERITDLHATKRDLADSLLEGTDMTGKLSTEELLQLIRE